MAPLILSGMSAQQLEKIVKVPNLIIEYPYGEIDTNSIKNNIIQQFVDCVGADNVITNNLSTATFNTDVNNGYFSFRYENSTKNIPIFSAYTSKPKRIFFSYKYVNSRNVMTKFTLRFKPVSNQNVNYVICNASDPYYDSSKCYSYYDNGKKVWFYISSFTTYSGKFDITDVATQLPNCFLEDEQDYIMEILWCLSYAGYTTSPFYVKDFKIEF